VDILKTVVYANPVWMWLVAVAVVALSWLILHVLTRLLVNRLKGIAQKTPSRFDDLLVDLLSRTRLPFILVVAFYAGSALLVLPDAAKAALHAVFVLALLLQAGYWADSVVTFWIRRTADRKLQQDAAAATSLSAFAFAARAAIWTLVVLVALDNLGIRITTLLAGVGIGGIAIALAVQRVLSDLFASLSILIDRPFVIGDFIVVGDLMGTVDRIGLKTTRVHSLSGEQIIFSNSDLLASRVRNYKQLYERRIAFSFGVTYQTPLDALEGIPALVEGIVENLPDVRFDRCHFKAFGPSSLDFEVVYYVVLPSYVVYMDRQQAINLAIMRAFEARGIEFAYPTQTLYVGRLGASEKQ